MLESQGFEVYLVNARHVKNVPGHKTDVKDCQWLQQLHTYGLLRASFRPAEVFCTLRSYERQRKNLVQDASRYVQRMQKSLMQMNLHLHQAISDISGQTGRRIIEAIIRGERKPHQLARLRGHGIRSNEATLVKALTGDYRDEHIFTLKQAYELYQTYQEKIAECDTHIQAQYARMNGDDKGGSPQSVQAALKQLTGVDLLKLPGIQALSAQALIAEVGTDMSRWRTEKHFASWLGLSPGNKITGGKVYSTRTCKVVNRASVIFRMAALCVSRTDTAIGAYYRRLKGRLGAPKAITATARKLACLFYRLLKFGEDYVEQGADYYEKAYHIRVFKNLMKKANMLGYELVKKEEVAQAVPGVV